MKEEFSPFNTVYPAVFKGRRARDELIQVIDGFGEIVEYECSV